MNRGKPWTDRYRTSGAGTFPRMILRVRCRDCYDAGRRYKPGQCLVCDMRSERKRQEEASWVRFCSGLVEAGSRLKDRAYGA